jgi:dTDP-4-dehydrorhamnose 3,5-epimerase
MAFKGKSNGTNLILNIADLEHDPDEIVRLDLNRIDYNWNAE